MLGEILSFRSTLSWVSGPRAGSTAVITVPLDAYPIRDKMRKPKTNGPVKTFVNDGPKVIGYVSPEDSQLDSNVSSPKPAPWGKSRRNFLPGGARRLSVGSHP